MNIEELRNNLEEYCENRVGDDCEDCIDCMLEYLADNCNIEYKENE